MGSFSSRRKIPTLPVRPSVDNRVNQTRRALRFTVAVDFHMRQIERIEAHFDAFAGQLWRRFKEAVAQQERGVAAHQAVDAMKEQAAHVGGGRQLPDLFDVALPAQQRSRVQRAVLMAMIDGVEPVPEPLVQRFQREQRLGIERGEKLLAHGTEETFDLAAAFGLIGRRVNDEDADGGGDARRAQRAPPASDRSWRCPCRGAWEYRGRRWLGAGNRETNPTPDWDRTARAE